MRFVILAIFITCAPLLRAQQSTPNEEVPSVTARSQALELAGAFANDGFKIRDGFWGGAIEAKKPQFLQVNLFAGNAYWFSASVVGIGRKLSLSIATDAGQPVQGDTFQSEQSVAFGFVPQVSGRYFVRLELTTGEKSDFALVYSYK